MKKFDAKILRTIPDAWPHLTKILKHWSLIPQDTPLPTGAIAFAETLHSHHLTMADILHVLTLSSAASLKSTYILRQIYTTLLPSLPSAATPFISMGTIAAVYPEFLLTPNSAYRVGAHIADLHLILGIPMWVIRSDIRRGAIILDTAPPNPLYSARAEEYTSTEDPLL